MADGGGLADLPVTRGWHDPASRETLADRPTPVQVDEDFIGDHT